MASLYDTSATKALNEDAYINKLYDGTLESQKKALQQGYDNSVKQLTTGQDSTKKQTSDYVKRAYVEGQRAAGHVQKPAPKISTPGMGNGGAGAQARLTMANQQQKNVSMLNNQQTVAELEYERQRKLLADKYESQIKQAQADNDMNRAQALYDAAKAEEEQLRALRQSAAALMATKDDNSIYDAIARGDSVERDTTSETWDSVLKNEESINKIYDAQLESERQAAEIAHKQSMSELDAQQKEAQRQTDEALNNAYVEALKKNQNYQEVQNAYGQGSGAAMQARLAREAGLTEKLTELRKLQQTKDAKNEMDKAEQVASLGDKLADSQQSIDKNRAKALYDAAEKEEQNLIADQQLVGNQYAKNGDYTMLARLYGLTPEQLGRLQNVGGGGGGGGGYRSSGGGGNGGNTGGSTIAGSANPTIIPLGYGPISNNTLQGLVSSGKVNATTNSSGGISYSKAPTSSAGITMQLANAGKPVYTASSSKSNSSGGGVVSKVVNAVKSWFKK